MNILIPLAALSGMGIEEQCNITFIPSERILYALTKNLSCRDLDCNFKT